MFTKSIAPGFWLLLIVPSIGLITPTSPCWSQSIDLGAGQLDAEIGRRAVNEDVPGDRRSLDDTTKRDHLRVSPTTPNLILPESERNAVVVPVNGALSDGAASGQGTINENQQALEWVLVDQSAMIALAQIGMTRTESSELRQLAELVFQHHRAFAAQLAQYRTAEAAVPVASHADMGVGRHVRGIGPTTPAEEQAAETRENILVQQRRINDVRREAGDVPVSGEVAEGARERLDAAIDTDRGVRNEVIPSPETIEGRAIEGRAIEGRAIEGRAIEGRASANASLRLRKEIVERFSALVRDDLQGRTGADFDASFLNYLVVAHLQQEAMLDVIRVGVAGAIEDSVNDAIVQVRRHRAIAERMRIDARR